MCFICDRLFLTGVQFQQLNLRLTSCSRLSYSTFLLDLIYVQCSKEKAVHVDCPQLDLVCYTTLSLEESFFNVSVFYACQITPHLFCKKKKYVLKFESSLSVCFAVVIYRAVKICGRIVFVFYGNPLRLVFYKLKLTNAMFFKVTDQDSSISKIKDTKFIRLIL